MSSSESDRRLHPVEIARLRQEPESYEEQLIPEALNLIRAVAHGDQDIDLALKGLSDEHLQALKSAETEEEFKKAILSAFHDRSIYIIAGTLGILDKSIAVINGRSGDTLEEIFDDNHDIVSRVNEIKATARGILRQLRSDILSPDMEPELVGPTY
ncbi:hypothetical protein A3B51_00880 [Candidatus Curtissbacteria bacterium RIFCSPLOWO2_01_FULL_41_18]|uniref:Uncharacterized protein n=1 Tax=Candidatus Curtissbacteria bacterium RIFCSPLOWO2_01_FULL_41_18 TaxID=1797727 RepID=A0A1F5HHT9_9BACT|nr:MAG: hypothetical protein A3B51_00880 [Candidatus Curtissbacteria bacterium RIFCSPLOWO2_01_FULL_41_18]